VQFNVRSLDLFMLCDVRDQDEVISSVVLYGFVMKLMNCVMTDALRDWRRVPASELWNSCTYSSAVLCY